MESKRFGTFERWHQVAREHPIAGEMIEEFHTGAVSYDVALLFSAIDKRLPLLPTQGVSFLDCIRGTPGMYEWLHLQNIQTKLLRSKLDGRKLLDGSMTKTLITHPYHDEIVQDVATGILILPSDLHRVELKSITNGFRMTVNTTSEDMLNNTFPNIILPQAMNWTNKETFLCAANTPLNEFGYIYIGLFILGSYARYYTDRWMRDVEERTPLALAADEFLAFADWRIAWLAMCELSQTCYVMKP